MQQLHVNGRRLDFLRHKISSEEEVGQQEAQQAQSCDNLDGHSSAIAGALRHLSGLLFRVLRHLSHAPVAQAGLVGCLLSEACDLGLSFLELRLQFLGV